MKKLKKHIKEEINRLLEKEYDIPSEILDVLKNRLKMDPIVRYIDYFKTINSIPPSYRIFLHNGETFDIVYEDFSLLADIGSKQYYLMDIDETNYAIKHINRLLTGSIIKPDEEGEDIEGDAGGSPPSPPPSPSPEPEEEA